MMVTSTKRQGSLEWRRALNLIALLLITARAALACETTPSTITLATGSANPAGTADVENPGNQSNQRISITNDESTLEGRVTIRSQGVPIETIGPDGTSSVPGRWIRIPGVSRKAATGIHLPIIDLVGFRLLRQQGGLAGFSRTGVPPAWLNIAGQDGIGPRASRQEQQRSISLTLVAEVSPPTANGQLLQTSSVVIKGKTAYVSYNMRGETYLGAIDVIDIKDVDRPRLVSQAIFLDSDIHSVSFEKGKLYAAQTTSNPEFPGPARFEQFTTKGNNLVLDENSRGTLAQLRRYLHRGVWRPDLCNRW